jgi:nucleotide-binding universal stress UspA family protein
MYARILVAIDDVDHCQPALDMVKDVATAGVTEVRALHLRLREVSGFRWQARETRDEASFVAEAATFELRMAGLSAGGGIRYAAVDRAAEAIVDEAEDFDADLVVLGAPKRGEVLTRLFGSVSLRVIRRARCPVLLAPRRPRAEHATAPEAPASGLRS